MGWFSSATADDVSSIDSEAHEIVQHQSHTESNDRQRYVNGTTKQHSKADRTHKLRKKDLIKIREFNNKVFFESKECLHHLVTKSAEAVPRKAAVAAWDGSLTYNELEEGSSRFACLLIEHGLQPGQFVPFCFEKSLWMIVAVLGIIKAGGAFVPIGIDQPETRIASILMETKAEMVVVSQQQSSLISKISDANVLIASARTVGRFDQLARPSRNPKSSLPRIVSSDTAMVLYTSGSTGKPKGIVHSHGAISTKALAEGEAFRFRDARVLQFAATTWDVFVMDVFSTLICEGCICVPSEEDRISGLAEFCKTHKVNFSTITPTLANALEPRDLPTLKQIILGGEALKADTVAKWLKNGSVTILQGYGPAETGPCTVIEVSDDQRPEHLGRPLDNSCCILVDPEDATRIVPLGDDGELVVGGPSILQFYLNEPQKTREAIVEKPQWAWDLGLPFTRFYKTGDILRYSLSPLDGSFEFVRRKDGQVKYHGQRIEVEEIEHHLRAMPGVIAGLVALPTKGILTGKLTAIVQETKGTGLISSETGLQIDKHPTMRLEVVRKVLASQLPLYMIPTELVVVKTIPFTSSMKIDRHAVNSWLSDLRKQDLHSFHNADDGERSLLGRHEKTAREIAKRFAKSVPVTRAGEAMIGDEYDIQLQAGGIDSVQIMLLATYISKSFGIQVPMSVMFGSTTTIRDLAAIIDDAPKTQTDHLTSRSSMENEIDLLLSNIEKDLRSGTKRLNVFLTGATGYLGMELLRQLLSYPNIHVYALIRSSSVDDAMERLVRSACSAGWWQPDFLKRMVVCLGDLSQPQLGLSKKDWLMLCSGLRMDVDVDIIVHNGAKVNYTMDYAALKQTNVSSTVELLKAIRHRSSPLRSFVFVSGGHQLSFSDDTDDVRQAAEGVPSYGYVKSKAVSELLVRRYAETNHHGAQHIKIVKPGFIIGKAHNGRTEPTDFLWRLIAACIEAGSYDASRLRKWLFVADVSRVATVVISSALEQNATLIRKVLDGLPIEALWNVLQTSFQFDLTPLPRRDWLDKISDTITRREQNHPLFPLKHILDDMTIELGVDNGPPTPSTGVEQALKSNIQNLINIGFLKSSSSLRFDSASKEDNNVMMANSLNLSSDAINMREIRQHFPALGGKFVAFNNAAGTVVLKEAWEATRDFMSAFPLEVFGEDEDSLKKTAKLENDRQILAKFVNADPDEIAWGQSTTFLLRCLAQSFKPLLNADAEMVVSNMCHEASASAWVALAHEVGITIKWWAPPVGRDDVCLSLETLKPLLTPKTRLVTCNHVSNVVGTIHPIREIADAVHQIPGAVLIVDGVAWAPHRPVDVKALDVDFYCFSWYKAFGPHIAQLYGRRSVQSRMMTSISHYFLDGMPGLDWKLRLGNNAFELETALAPIAKYLDKIGWDAIIAQETLLTGKFLLYLRSRPDVFKIFGEKTPDPLKRVSVVTFCVNGHASSSFAGRILRQGRFRITSGECWAPRPTHDVLGLPDDGLVRVSFVHYNTVAEVKELCETMDKILLDSSSTI